MAMDKTQIAAILDEMGTLLELKGENPFKSRAFHNASRLLAGVTGDLAAMAEAGELRSIKGIGESTAKVISDLVKTGVSPALSSNVSISGIVKRRSVCTAASCDDHSH